MANPEHLAALEQGVEQWHKWLREHPGANDVDLRGADLQGKSLSRVNLGRADLRGANLSGADLTQAFLIGADLRGANLNQAGLHAASLSRAGLAGASLIGADLSNTSLGGARITGANLSGTLFAGASAGQTYFANLDLSVAKGLEVVRHYAPSTVGIDTIYQSKGNIPEQFLRGCGVPDEFIAYVGSMVGRPIEFYSCFISYSTGDQDFADRLYADLQSKGVRCWFAPHDMQGGKLIHEQIDQAIRRYERLLLILSEHSIASGWVETEIANAWERQIDEQRKDLAGHVLFPVRLMSFEALQNWTCPDPQTGRDLAREIRKYFIPDFSNWKNHDLYQQAFERLVKDLKASAG